MSALDHSEEPSEEKDLADVVLAGLGDSTSSISPVAALSNKKTDRFSSGESMPARKKEKGCCFAWIVRCAGT